MIVHKSAAVVQVGGDFHFVMSDATQDRLGDTIEPDGWDLTDFRAYPVALINHGKHDPLPIGSWSDIRIERGQLKGKLNLGSTPRIDEYRALLEQGHLIGASVGFLPVDSEPLPNKRGTRFKRQKMVECSLVSVPANPAALLIAKDLVSADTMALVFGASAEQDAGSSAPHAARQPLTPPGRKPGTMTAPTIPIAALIEDAQTKHLAAQDRLNEHLAATPDDPDEASLGTRDALIAAAESAKRNLESLYATERALGAAAVPGTPREPAARAVAPVNNGARVFAAPAKNLTPADRALQVLAGIVCSWATKGQKTVYEAIAERYGSDGKIEEKTKLIADMVLRREGMNPLELIQRTATAPATTTTSGWASHLLETSTQGWTNLLMPAAAFPGLASRAIRLNFGRAGVISVPTRAATPTVAGSFVAEGSPIPVRQAAFTSITFNPKKMAVITSFTREIAEHSNPTLEGLLRMAIQEDTSVSLDTVLIDATAATAVRPGGIRAGVTVTTATAGGGFAALIGDLKGLVGALLTNSNGNLRNPVWLMNPIQALSIGWTQNAGGDFPFQGEINNGTLAGYPVIRSPTVTAGMVILLDAADFVVLEGGAPRFDLSDQTVLVYDDTAPAQIGTVGSPGVVGAPARSMFQTDSIALRMIFDVNWGFVRTGTVAWTQAVTW